MQASAQQESAGAIVSSTFASRQEAEAKALAYERRLRSAQQVVEELKGGIASLFQTAVSASSLACCDTCTIVKTSGLSKSFSQPLPDCVCCC